MSFFEKPILNSPYVMPKQQWELDDEGRPTDRILDSRRRSDLISAMPQAKSKKPGGNQAEMELSAQGLSGLGVEFNVTEFVNEIRREVDVWRSLPNPSQWQVSPVTQRLLVHWRALQVDESQTIRPFFCQLEAVEVAIWLAEVAPKLGPRGKRFRERLEAANTSANPDLFRIALKLATGAGKTTVMAMLIAWQVLNAVRTSNSKNYTRGFLIVTPADIASPHEPRPAYGGRFESRGRQPVRGVRRAGYRTACRGGYVPGRIAGRGYLQARDRAGGGVGTR